MSDCIIVHTARKKMLEARAGIRALSPIKGVAFGNGAVNESGEVIVPNAGDVALKNELLRKDIDGYEIVSDLRIRYICTLEKNDLAGEQINEVALFDTDGDIVAIKSFLNKGKDGDMQMIIEIDDTFEEEI